MQAINTKQVRLLNAFRAYRQARTDTCFLACSYRFASLCSIRSALAYSTKSSLRTDASGILSMQFMIVSVAQEGGASGGFVEFTCMPLSEEDE